MKYILPLLFFSSASFAQINVSHTDFVPLGRSFIMAYDTALHQPGNCGANQTWDFSDAQETFIDTMAVSDPDTTPYSFYFPSANVCFQPFSVSGYYEYCSNDSTGFYIQGLVSVSPNYSDFSVFTPAAKYFSWPMQYGDTFNDSFYFISRSAMLGPNGMDSMKYEAWYNNRTKVDAWGQLTTPLGTFSTLRQEKFMSMTANIWSYSAQTGIWTFVQSFTDTSIQYDWLTNDANFGYVLASVSYSPKYQQHSGLNWMKGTIAGIKDYHHTQTISVYPNPAEDILHMQAEHAGILELRDVNGGILKSEKVNRGIQTIDISDFSAGIYFLTLTDTENKFLPDKAKVIFEK